MGCVSLGEDAAKGPELGRVQEKEEGNSAILLLGAKDIIAYTWILLGHTERTYTLMSRPNIFEQGALSTTLDLTHALPTQNVTFPNADYARCAMGMHTRVYRSGQRSGWVEQMAGTDNMMTCNY